MARRAAAIASPCRICSFSRVRNASIPASNVSRSTVAGVGARVTELRCGESLFIAAPGDLFIDVDVGRAEHVEMVEYVSRIGGPVHRRELCATAPAGSPPEGLESCCVQDEFGAVFGSAAILRIFDRHLQW